MRIKLFLLIFILSIIIRANEKRIFFTGGILNFDDSENDFNIEDYYDISSGIFVDTNYLKKMIETGYYYDYNPVHRFYNPYNVNRLSISYLQRTKINDKLFFNGRFEVDNSDLKMKHSLEINPYDMPFLFTDTTSGSLGGNRFYLNNSVSYKIKKIVISPEVSYGISNFLKDNYVKAETFNILFSYYICFTYLTDKNEIFVKIGSGLKKSKLVAVKELSNPEVFIKLGENVFKKRTSSSFNGFEKNDFNVFDIGFIHNFNNGKAIGSKISYIYNKYKIWDGKLSKNYWGLASIDSIFYDFTFKYDDNIMSRIYYSYSNNWTRSYDYNFLYQEEVLKKGGFSLSLKIDKGILTNYYNQLNFAYTDDKYSDYIGSFFYRKREVSFSNTVAVNRKITEFLDIDVAFNVGYIKNSKFFDFNDVRYSGISSVVRWGIYMVGFKYDIYFINSSFCNKFMFNVSLNFN